MMGVGFGGYERSDVEPGVVKTVVSVSLINTCICCQRLDGKAEPRPVQHSVRKEKADEKRDYARVLWISPPLSRNYYITLQLIPRGTVCYYHRCDRKVSALMTPTELPRS